MRSTWYAVVWAACGGCWLANVIATRAADAPATWAVLIGVGEYEKAPSLPFINNDIRQLAQTLRGHGGVDPARIFTIADDADNMPDKPTIVARVADWLKKPTAGDTIILYYSGHGFRDAGGKLYIAPREIDPANLTAGGVAVEWLRDQLIQCPAAFKLLILDSCHAGAEKGSTALQSISAKDLGDQFKSATGVVTLASSTAEEKSQIWDFKQQSLFSYWLKEGLKGHADSDGDGGVTLDELYAYLHGHVVQTAKIRFQRSQTPVRIVGPKTPGVPVVVKLHPQALKQVLTDMAEQLAGAMEERQQPRLGVLEFSNDTKFGELLGANFGLLGRYCAEELERRLGDRAAGKFAVIDRGRLLTALKQQNFGLKDLSSSQALSDLSNRAGGLPVLVRGTLRDRTSRMVTVRCRLEQTQGETRLADVGGMALLSESEWAMLGRSAEVALDDRRPERPDSVAPPKADEDRVVERLDEKSRDVHPLQDPKFPYSLQVFVKGQERKGTFKKVNDAMEYFVPLKAGEVYEIRVWNKTAEPIMMKLLVDGLNTLPEPEKVKGVTTYLWGQRVNLEDARAWVLDPKAPGTSRQGEHAIWGIRGFVTETGATGKWREFTVVDADKALATRRQYTDQIGLVTAAFYSPTTGTRAAVGTAAGEERTANLAERELVPGKLRAVVHVRYVDVDSLR